METPWAVASGDETRATSAGETFPHDPAVYWTAEAGRAAAAAFAVGDSVIVVQDTRKILTVVWRHDGSRAWSARVRGEGNTGPLLGRERVFTATGGSDGHIYAYRVESGRSDWNVSFAFAEGALALSDARLFAASETGSVIALERDTGAEVWRLAIGAPTVGGVTLIDGRVTVATFDSIMALDRATGERVRAAPLPAQVRSLPAVSGSVLVFASPEGVLFALDRSTFAVRWTVELGEPSFGGVVIARDTIFATSISGRLWRVPFDNPEAASHLDFGAPVRSAPTPIRGGVLVGTLAGDLLLLGDSATPLWSTHVDGPIDVAPIVDRGVLFFVDGRGRLHAWH